jgi:hypothetical protein
MIKALICIVCSLVLNFIVEVDTANNILNAIVFNAVSVMVGLSIAVYSITASSIDKIKNLTSDKEMGEIIEKNSHQVLKEIMDNSLFSLISYVIIIVLFFVKNIPESFFPCIRISQICFVQVCNIVILSIMFLIFLAIYDTIRAVYKTSGIENLLKKR